jgi:hypothetical protein
MHYGSPVAFDLAGMGKIGKELRELIKDIFIESARKRKKQLSKTKPSPNKPK